ncbi:MAG: glycosyltransferase family 2 protein [Leptospiraceae bacterium]|nr:glycosyltransferase family 2 protein [Leptospiraceae bacterium]MDW8305850.1 glycosyltransferase family 2 protein [Leptospiraceae bacterium]
MSISATIIAYNEEKDIQDCIRSVQQICDDIIVLVDSKTTDNTAKLARQLGARVYVEPYLGDGPQKALGASYAQNDWILSIDADERLDQDLLAFLQRFDPSNSSCDAYAFRRRNHVGKRWLKAPGFYPDYVVRLYHRKRAGYLPLPYHSYVKAKRIKKVNAHFIHYTYDSYADWLTKLRFHSEMAAQGLYLQGKRATRGKALIHATIAFMKQYIYQLGFLYGFDGFTVALTTFFATYFKYLMLLDYYRNPSLIKEKLNKGGDRDDGLKDEPRSADEDQWSAQ